MTTKAALTAKWKRYHERFSFTFWNRVDSSGGPDACWPYTGSKRAAGYGRLRLHGKYKLAHRIAYGLHYGAPDENKMVCHTCDNPPCCNPGHLFLGDQTANMQDRSAKGRAPLHRAKLTPEQVETIKGRLANGERAAALAREYDVKATAISRIKTGRTWKWPGIASLRAREGAKELTPSKGD